jgi:hypothetical protein
MRMGWARHIACTRAKRNAYRILMGRLEGKRPLGRPAYMPEDNIKMVLTDIGWGGMDWICLAQNRSLWRALVNTIMNLLVPKIAGKFFCSLSSITLV